MAILEKLILGLIVIALPLGEIARFSFNEVSITLLDFGVAVTILWWLFIKRRLPSSNLRKPVIFFTVALLISLIANIPRLNINEFSISFLYLVRWVLYSFLFFTILDLSSVRLKISRVMLIGGIAIVMLGYIQYFLYPDLRNLRYAGWDEHLYRMFTTFFDPNFAGSFFVLYFLFVSSKFNFKDKKTFILPVIVLIAIFLTFSRSAYVALIIGIAVYSFLLKRKKAAIILIILIIGSIILLSKTAFKSEGTNILRTASGEARLDSVKNALIIFKDHPIFGVGFNSYRYAQRDYGFINESKQSLRSGELKMIIHSGAGTDNSFLFILATSGIIGFSAFLYLLFNILAIKDSLIRASIVALIINSFFINSLFYPPIMLWLWILLGLRLKNT